MSGSPQFSLNTEDLYKVVRGAAIIGVSGFLVNFLETLPSVDFGVWDQAATVLCASLLELVRRYLKDYA